MERYILTAKHLFSLLKGDNSPPRNIIPKAPGSRLLNRGLRIKTSTRHGAKNEKYLVHNKNLSCYRIYDIILIYTRFISNWNVCIAIKAKIN